MKLNEKNIFLVDGLGAILSALTTGLILPFFSEWLGFSKENLCLLALLPVVFAFYSLACFWFAQRIKPIMLLGIISANSLYCLLAWLIVLYSAELLPLGRAIFLAETFIVLGIVFIEVKVYQKSFGSHAD